MNITFITHGLREASIFFESPPPPLNNSLILYYIGYIIYIFCLPQMRTCHVDRILLSQHFLSRGKMYAFGVGAVLVLVIVLVIPFKVKGITNTFVCLSNHK